MWVVVYFGRDCRKRYRYTKYPWATMVLLQSVGLGVLKIHRP